MKRVFALPLIGLCMAFVAARPADKPAISQPETAAERQVGNKSNRVVPESKDRWRIASKWDVKSVQRDGKPQHGQVGQEVDDVITIMVDGGLLAFG